MTRKWGSGNVWSRICKSPFGIPDIVFGKTDGIPEDVLAIDRNINFEWKCMPFHRNEFVFGYWDPPYDKLYKKEAQEIWRVCKKLAILHPSVYPTSWFEGAIRVGMIPVTFGPLKVIRCLQVFEKIPGTGELNLL